MRPQNPAELAGEFEALLSRAAASATALAASLAQERRALQSEDLDRLASAAAAKQARLVELESLEAERCALLVRCGLHDDAAGMQGLLAGCEAAATLEADWQRYLGLAEECRRENLVNGAIIRLRRQQLAATLTALSGSRSTTYGPDGSSESTASRSLAEA